MNVNGMELIEACRSLEVKGWKQTKLLNEEYHEILERELTAETKQVVDTFPKIKCNIS
jgi:hypothetical protein